MRCSPSTRRPAHLDQEYYRFDVFDQRALHQYIGSLTADETRGAIGAGDLNEAACAWDVDLVRAMRQSWTPGRAGGEFKGLIAA